MTKTLVDDCFRPSQSRLSHIEALATLKLATQQLAIPSAVDVCLAEANGRVLAYAAVSQFPVPAHTNAAVDGYAFQWVSVFGTGSASLPVVGRAAAGHPMVEVARPDAAVRIFTGAVLPEGLDTVVMQEDVDVTGGNLPTVRIPTGLKAGANVRKAGEDVAAGEALFERGHRVRPQDLAALASLGLGKVTCYRQLKIAIVSTGDEVRPAGSEVLKPGQVYDANAPMLAALATVAGAQIHQLGIWSDTREAVIANLREAAATYDVILTSGGASLGEEDHMAAALEAVGTRHLWQIAIKPGRPMMFGQIKTGERNTVVVGLPGNPVAVFVCFLMYVHPLLRALGGSAWREPRRFLLPASFNFSGRKTGRREFWRARIIETETGMAAEKFTRDGSGLISGLRWSDGLIDIPEHNGDIQKGDLVAFIPFSEFGIS
jgi:molybdopterin molybdotransferase